MEKINRHINTLTIFKSTPRVYNHHDNCNFCFTDVNGRSLSGIDTVINLKRRYKNVRILEINDIVKWYKSGKKTGYQIIKN